MAYKIEFVADAEKELSKIDRKQAQRILKFLSERISQSNNPRTNGKALKGSKLGNLWRYRVGDYRIICDIQDECLIVLVLRIGHRSKIY